MRLSDYSERKAVIGFTPLARRAGNQQATLAIVASNTPTGLSVVVAPDTVAAAAKLR